MTRSRTNSVATMNAFDKARRGIFLGIELECINDSIRYCIYLHDGFYSIDYFLSELKAPAELLTHPANRPSDAPIPTGIGKEVDGNNGNGSGDEDYKNGLPIKEDVNRSETFMTDIDSHYRSGSPTLIAVEDEIIEWLRVYADMNNYKFLAVGVGISPRDEMCLRPGSGEVFVTHYRDANEVRRRRNDDYGEEWPIACLLSDGQAYKERLRLPVRLWQELDVLPFIVPTGGHSIDERACQAVRKIMQNLAPSFITNIPRNPVGYLHEVEVDCKSSIRLCDIHDYISTTHPRLFKVFDELTQFSRDRKLCASFFSSTSQGGGVAIMRHSLGRLFNLADLDIHWYVARPKPEVFEITKFKIHNVLQGVAPPDAHLTEHDMELYENWSEDNARRYWMKGPFVKSHVIVIDDPQLCGIIPYIKRVNPKCKLIFRSHIEIRSDLTDKEGTEAHHVFKYLWQFIKQCDIFISHPVPKFTPACVPSNKLLYMGATADLLDGLNKTLRQEDINFYWCAFNRLCYEQTGLTADFWNRPYITQLARFDPSKGIPDVLKSYKLVRKHLVEKLPISQVPFLVLAGMGSIDDPEGSLIFDNVSKLLQSNEYEDIKDDVFMARLPPCDQLLNALLSGALLALQLSIREGFEIKVTEALMKGRPVIAYNTGGIPLQIEDGVDGYLFEVGDVGGVASRVVDLVLDEEKRKKMGTAAANLQCKMAQTKEMINALGTYNSVDEVLRTLASRPCGARQLDQEENHYVPNLWRAEWDLL
ncbi:hypothetical protein HDV05_004890 [Chytridiales sp. JEL 0842]|nr:hypothetical protein HDV05_004890 [Chytridiales sp. JEL 0842]